MPQFVTTVRYNYNAQPLKVAARPQPYTRHRPARRPVTITLAPATDDAARIDLAASSGRVNTRTVTAIYMGADAGDTDTLWFVDSDTGAETRLFTNNGAEQTAIGTRVTVPVSTTGELRFKMVNESEEFVWFSGDSSRNGDAQPHTHVSSDLDRYFHDYMSEEQVALANSMPVGVQYMGFEDLALTSDNASSNDFNDLVFALIVS